MHRDNRKSILAILLLVVFVLLAVTGCSKVNQENYDKLSFGMEYEAAVDIMGAPDSCESVFSGKSCTWGDEKKNIHVKVVGDKVVYLSSTGL